MYSSRVPLARQDGYDQIPATIQQRDDLTSGAKRLYGLLQSVQRMRIAPDYRWLAAELAASVRSIVRWVQQLAAAGLIAVRRRGQGQSNLITVLALVTSGREILPRLDMPGWRTRPGTPLKKGRTDQNNRGTTAQSFDASAYYVSREGDIRTRT